MSSYLDEPTVKTRLSAYAQTADFEMDTACLRNEYELLGKAVPPEKELRQEVLRDKKDWLEQLSECESEGHQFTETADGENGTSDLECSRCGMTQHCQW